MSEPIRILFLDTIMDRGGAQTMVMNYYRKIDRSKVQFDFLIHRDYQGAFDDEIESLGGRIFHIIPPYPQNYFKYKKQIKSFFDLHPEYRILHSNMTETGLFAFVEAKKRGIPVRIVHAHTAVVKKRLNFKKIVIKVYQILIKHYLTHKFSCGIAAANYVYGSCENVTILPNAIDTTSFKYDPFIEHDIRKEWNLQNKFIIGHVGRFSEPKNHNFIIDVFYQVYQKNKDAVLMLVGGLETEKEAITKIKKKVYELGLENAVIFAGQRNDIHRIMQAFDVFILPSLWEGFPVVMVEAQAIGINCIISDKISNECILTNDSKVVPLSVGAKGWANTILETLSSHKGILAAENIVNKGYDLKKNAEWLQTFYLEKYYESKTIRGTDQGEIDEQQ